MGFSPSGNAGLCFPDRMLEMFGDNLGEQLDEVLEDFYELCTEFQVPILAHAAPGNQAGDGFGNRAHPEHWRAVFECHPEIRVCLAHSGGFHPGANGTAPWEDTIVSMIKSGIPGLYMDLAFLSAVFDSQERRRALNGLSAINADEEAVFERVVFGSDWHMLAQIAGNADYAGHIDQLLSDAGLGTEARSEVFARNGAVFLNLRPGSAALERLGTFYGQYGPAWSQIEALASL
jgi:predicted TIM-barrel fold metal-dependent hydrolase